MNGIGSINIMLVGSGDGMMLLFVFVCQRFIPSYLAIERWVVS